MRSNKTSILIPQDYSDQRHRSRHQINNYKNQEVSQLNIQYGNSTLRKQHQKTEQKINKQISLNAIKRVNDQIYKILNMDPHDIEFNLRNSTKSLIKYINTQLLFSFKHTSAIKLLLHNLILIYIHESANQRQDNIKSISKEKSKSIKKVQLNQLSSYENIQTNKYLNDDNYSQRMSNTSSRINSMKQTMPNLPKPKQKQKQFNQNQQQNFIHSSLMNKSNNNIKNLNNNNELYSEQLLNQIQSTSKYLQSILLKFQNQYNQSNLNQFKLSGQDIIKLKKSYINVSEIKKNYAKSLNQLKQTNLQLAMFNQKNSQNKTRNIESKFNSRNTSQQCKQSKQFIYSSNDINIKQSPNRNQLKNKTYFNHTNQNSYKKEEEKDITNQILIQQLQQIIQKKQNRIKQLTKELSKNLSEQKQLQTTIETFQVQLNQFEVQRKKYQEIIEKLQQENLNFQLEISDLKQKKILQEQKEKNNIDNQLQNMQTFEYLKKYQKRQKILKFSILNEVSIYLQNNSSLSKDKQLNLFTGNSAFNDISQITPKRLQNLEISQDRNYVPTIRKGNNSIEKTQRSKQKTKKNNQESDTSFHKFTLYNNNKTVNKTTSLPDEIKDNQKQNYEKILLLQALTIEQLMESL